MTIDEYVRDVMRRIPDENPHRTQIEADLRAHLAASLEDGHSEADAIARMGTPSEVAAGFMEEEAIVLATPRRRLAAFVLDIMLLLALLAIPLAVFLRLAWRRPMVLLLKAGFEWPFALAFVALAIVALCWILYFPVLEARSGQTFGKRVLGLRVVRTNGERIGFWRAVARRIPFYTQIPLLYALDGVFALFTVQRQRAFDRVAETKVIRTPARHTPLAWITVACSLLLIVGFGEQWRRMTEPPDGPRFPPIFGKGGGAGSCASRVVTPDGRDTLTLVGSVGIVLKDYRLIWARPFISSSTTFGLGLYMLNTVDQEHTTRIRLDCRSYTPLPGQFWQIQQVP